MQKNIKYMKICLLNIKAPSPWLQLQKSSLPIGITGDWIIKDDTDMRVSMPESLDHRDPPSFVGQNIGLNK